MGPARSPDLEAGAPQGTGLQWLIPARVSVPLHVAPRVPGASDAVPSCQGARGIREGAHGRLCHSDELRE